MTEAQQFIVETLQEITAQIPEAAIRYAYDDSVEFHIIEVAPEEVRRGDDGYMQLESKLWKDFYSRFPEEELIIATPCHTHDMEHLLYERNDTGKDMETLCLP